LGSAALRAEGSAGACAPNSVGALGPVGGTGSPPPNAEARGAVCDSGSLANNEGSLLGGRPGWLAMGAVPDPTPPGRLGATAWFGTVGREAFFSDGGRSASAAISPKISVGASSPNSLGGRPEPRAAGDPDAGPTSTVAKPCE
jgi:hypothetical protein